MIYLSCPKGPLPFDPRMLEHAAEAALAHQSTSGDISIVITDDAKLQQLNREYLGVDAPTDVLSFPAGETDPESGTPYLGDILISLPRAQQQANAGPHPIAAELQLLVVHGVLHLLGYDHAEPAGKTRMWTAQAAILNGLGLGAIQIHDS